MPCSGCSTLHGVRWPKQTVSLQIFLRQSSADVTWPILEYLDPFIPCSDIAYAASTHWVYSVGFHYNYQGRMPGQGVAAYVKVLARVLRCCVSWLIIHPLPPTSQIRLIWLGLMNPLEKSLSPYFLLLWGKP